MTDDRQGVVSENAAVAVTDTRAVASFDGEALVAAKRSECLAGAGSR